MQRLRCSLSCGSTAAVSCQTQRRCFNIQAICLAVVTSYPFKRTPLVTRLAVASVPPKRPGMSNHSRLAGSPSNSTGAAWAGGEQRQRARLEALLSIQQISSLAACTVTFTRGAFSVTMRSRRLRGPMDAKPPRDRNPQVGATSCL